MACENFESTENYDITTANEKQQNHKHMLFNMLYNMQ